jgi:RNA polymerase sigma-70 factor (ECF subfamily)
LQDTEALQKIYAGDVKAFESVFEYYYQQLCLFTLKYLKDPDDAEEVVQDTFVRFWNKRKEINITSSLKSYLYQSVKNSSLNRIQHLKVVRDHEQSHVESISTPEPSDPLVEMELQEKINSTLELLPPERKKIFLMSRNEGLKYKEIADKLKISVKTVENQMGKALKFLRTELAEFMSVGLLLITEIIKKYL